MGRKRKARNLQVYVGSTKVGVYSRTPNGATLFQYAPDWLASARAFPISLSMPLSDRHWGGMTASSFFDGLLPDDSIVRGKIASREHAESTGTFDLLAAIGRDCVGALRFIPEEMDPGDSTKMIYRPVSNEEIAARLEALGTSPLGLNIQEDDFRISIAGVQEKTAFLNIDGKWNLPLGSTPTSHIFKPALMKGPNGADFSDTSWNEWLCLELCRALGLEAANANVLFFGGKPVLVVERFDRLWQNRVLYRLPQEDVCQSLGVSPTRKYQADGGPGIEDVLAFLNGAVVPKEDRLRFMTAQIIFWLLAAIDGHAKNFSVFLTPGGYKLTPLYDVMSASPYSQLSPHKIKLAMAVGKHRHYRIKNIQPRHFYETGQAAGLSKQDMDSIFSGLLARIEAALAEVDALAAKAGAPEATFVPILDGVEKCASLILTDTL